MGETANGRRGECAIVLPVPPTLCFDRRIAASSFRHFVVSPIRNVAPSRVDALIVRARYALIRVRWLGIDDLRPRLTLKVDYSL